MSEIQEQPKTIRPKGIFSKKNISRVIASTLVTSTIGLSGDTFQGGVSDQNSLPGISRELSLEGLEKRAEDLYQVKIISPAELGEIDFVGEKLKTAEWTKEAISGIATSLDRLPPHFYRPGPNIYRMNLPPLSTENPFNWPEDVLKKQNQDFYEQTYILLKKKLGDDFYISKEDFDQARIKGYLVKDLGISDVKFLMVDRETTKSKSWIAKCSCHEGAIEPQVLFGSDFFTKEYDGFRLSIIAHELTHRVTTNEDMDFVLGLVDTPKNVLFSDFLKSNMKQIEGKIESLLINRLDYGTTNAGEFISVASEFYIKGKPEFLKVYGEFIGKEKAGKLYDHMGDSIFKGQEYRDGEKLTQSSRIPFLTDGSLNYGNGVIGPSLKDKEKANLRK